MIRMNFISFLILLIISLVVSGILHSGIKYNIVPGWWAYLSKVLIGWFGYWWEGVNYKQVYSIPAILCCLLLLIFAVDSIKACSTTIGKE